MSSSKAPAGRITAPDAELFAIRLGVSKATSMDIERIILITDSLGSARRSVDPSEDKASGEGFLEAEEAETLLEERLAMRRVWGLPLE